MTNKYCVQYLPFLLEITCIHMATIKLILLLALFKLFLPALIYVPGVPVNWLTLLKAQVALNRWQLDLINNYGKKSENPYRTKFNTDLVNEKLQALSNELRSYNNNGVSGTNNLIIGSSNTVLGNNNYIFTSGFSTLNNSNAKPDGTLNRTLVSDNWVGELDRRHEIITNLHSVIYPIS